MDIKSQFARLFESLAPHLLWIVPLLILAFLSKLSSFKGWLGEVQVNLALKLSLRGRDYVLLKNVTLPTKDGSTQIDHVLVSRFGIFVIETKNMHGWIFGSRNQKMWTQQIYRFKTQFQNPLHQNYKHTKALEECLGLPVDAIHSVVVFVGGSTFKSEMPENVTYCGGLIDFIRSKRAVLLSDEEVSAVSEAIRTNRLQPSWKTRKAHIEHVQEIQERKANAVLCPKCGSEMILRTAKKGDNAGNQFWGCSKYPRCRSIVSA